MNWITIAKNRKKMIQKIKDSAFNIKSHSGNLNHIFKGKLRIEENGKGFLDYNEFVDTFQIPITLVNEIFKNFF